MTKRVAIVDEGEWGDVRRARGDYADLNKRLKMALEAAETSSLSGHKEKAAEVKIVQSVKEAGEWLQGYGAIIFTTRGMLGEAKKFAEQFSKIRVILLTGLIPEGEVVLFNKAWLRDRKQIEEIVLY